jgi:predicted transcriptional regulator
VPNTTTVQIDRDLKARLDRMKIHSRESYNDVLERLLEDLEDISPAALRRYEEIAKQVKAGKFKTHEQVRREWGL